MKTDNELIAEFMGLPLTKREVKFTGGTKEVPFQNWKYNQSWDWLMPVVEKIETLYDKAFPPDFIAKLLAKEPTIDHHYMDVIALPLSTKINEAYGSVVEFIKWYNQQKK